MNVVESTDLSRAKVPRIAAGPRFWVGWVLNSVLVGLAALAVGAETVPFAAGVIPTWDEANVDGYSVAWAVIAGGLLAGVMLGAFQWLFLRRWFPGGKPGGQRQVTGRGWVLASAIAFGLSFTVAWLVTGGAHASDYAHHGLPHAVDRAGIWGGLLIGAMVGGAQWLVLRGWLQRLRPKALRNAWWWIPANVVGFAMGWWVTAVVSSPVEAVLGPMTHFWGGAAFGVVFGMITGVGLRFFLRRDNLRD